MEIKPVVTDIISAIRILQMNRGQYVEKATELLNLHKESLSGEDLIHIIATFDNNHFLMNVAICSGIMTDSEVLILLQKNKPDRTLAENAVDHYMDIEKFIISLIVEMFKRRSTIANQLSLKARAKLSDSAKRAIVDQVNYDPNISRILSSA